MPATGPFPKWCTGCRRSRQKEQNRANSAARYAEKRDAAGVRLGPSHGTQRRYKLGCRCEGCRAANNEAQRRFRLRYIERNGHDPRKGKPRTRKPAVRGEAERRRDALRRARKRGADCESFSPVEVFERDGWVCGICAEAVDRTLVYPHPMSVSLDHVVPLSRHGEHSRANTRCSHLACNVKRGARLGTEEVLGARSCA